eukprot:s465_g26.t2
MHAAIDMQTGDPTAGRTEPAEEQQSLIDRNTGHQRILHIGEEAWNRPIHARFPLLWSSVFQIVVGIVLIMVCTSAIASAGVRHQPARSRGSKVSLNELAVASVSGHSIRGNITEYWQQVVSAEHSGPDLGPDNPTYIRDLTASQLRRTVTLVYRHTGEIELAFGSEAPADVTRTFFFAFVALDGCDMELVTSSTLTTTATQSTITSTTPTTSSATRASSTLTTSTASTITSSHTTSTRTSATFTSTTATAVFGIPLFAPPGELRWWHGLRELSRLKRATLYSVALLGLVLLLVLYWLCWACRAREETGQEMRDAMRMQALKWLVDSVKLQVDLESGVTFFLAGPSGKASQELPAWLPQKRAAPRDLPEGASAGSQGGLQQLIPELLPGALYCLDDGEAEIRRNAAEANAMLLQETLKLESDLPVEQMASAVICAMSDVGGQERSREVLLKCLGWADTLLDKCPARVVEPEVRGKFFEAAEKALLREEEEVASTALRFMAQLASTAETLRKGDDLVGHMCERLFDLMKKQQSLLTRRGELIIRLMCKRVDAKRFFATAAKTLETIEDPPFARNLVQVLNRGLLTGPETQKFRAQLRAESSGQVASASFPMILMKSWLCCPVSSLALSFWMNWYELAAQLATRLATMQRTEEIEEQLKHFVELLESPVFSDVRLQLLTRRRPALLRAVLRLAALLPQERALQRRLQVVETGLLLDRVTALRKPLMRQSCTAEAEELLASFDRVTVEHRWKDCIL